MLTAKLFTNGKSQAVRLPKDYRFSGTEVGVTRIGELVVLYPKESAWENFLLCEPASEDYGQHILEARQSDPQTPREDL